MKVKKPEHYLKIAVLGDAGVGKTSLCTRLTKDIFLPSYELTVGLSIHSYVANFRGQAQNVLLYDVAGQPRFGDMVDVFIRGSTGILLVYDCSSILTFFALEGFWLSFIRKHLPNVPIVLVASKIDQEEFIEISESQVEAFLLEYGDDFNFVSFVKASAKTGVYVADMVNEIVAACNVPPPFRMPGAGTNVLGGADRLAQSSPDVGTHALSYMSPSCNHQSLTTSNAEKEHEG